MAKTVCNKQFFVFHGEGFQQPVPNQCQEMIRNVDIFLFPKINSEQQEFTFWVLVLYT